MATLWRLFGDYLATYWRLFGVYLATFWWLFGVYLASFCHLSIQNVNVVNFDEFLNTWSLRSNSVTRQVNICDFFGEFQPLWTWSSKESLRSLRTEAFLMRRKVLRNVTWSARDIFDIFPIFRQIPMFCCFIFYYSSNLTSFSVVVSRNLRIFGTFFGKYFW